MRRRRRFVSGIASTLAARKIAQEDGLRREQATRLARMAWKYSNGNSRGKKRRDGRDGISSPVFEDKPLGSPETVRYKRCFAILPMKRWTPFLLQSLVSIALLVWIFWKEDFRTQTWQILTSAHPGWLMAGFLVAGAGNLIGVIRWGIFLRVLGISISPWDTVRLSFVGLFFNTFLVGAVGGDAVKVVWVVAKGQPKTAALLSVLMDRMSGFGALILCSTLFMIWRLDWLMRSAVVAGLVKSVFAYLLLVVLLLGISFLLSARGLTRRLPKRFPFRKVIIEFTEAYLQFVLAWRQTLVASLLSILVLLAYFLTFYLSARAFGLDVPVVEFFALMPAVDIISALPISLGGFGVREQLFVTLLADLWEVPAAQAVSISLGGALLSMLWGLFGVVVLPGYQRAARRVLRR
ncbi:MAG TPA: lysylphosphatidylglycerol synthase transmembrane domain-containing protein [Terrimicrobiaceae bacterium]|nr:lysylphosphatidylglycerol synthase transmembrane domain-containing protein [Terrimicrobiaceae bacterium]